MRERWQGQAGRVAVQLDEEISLAVEVDHPEAAETIVAYLQQLHQSAGDTFVESTALKLQVLKGSLTPLARLKNLNTLYLFSNHIEDITPLAQLENLNTLWLGNNKIKDLSPLVTNFGLSEGDVVNLYDNPLSNQARSEQIPALKARGVRVDH